MATEAINLIENNKKFFLSKWIQKFAQDPLSWTIIPMITLFFTIFLILPLSFTIYAAFVHNGELNLSAFSTIFKTKKFWDPFPNDPSNYFIQVDAPVGKTAVYKIRGYDYGIFLNTIFIGLLTTTVSLTIGLITAFFMARLEFRGKTVLSGLLLIPLVIPPFVSGIGYMALLGPAGLINVRFFEPLFGIKIIFEGIFAIVLVQSLHYFTLIYLNIYSSLMNNDPSLEEAAENMGAGKWTVARTVTLPLAMPGIASGSILVLILAMEDLGTPIIFANSNDAVAAKTITFYIMKNFTLGQTSSEINQITAILGGFLLLFAIIGFFTIRKYVSLKQYSMVSKGRAGKFRTIQLGTVGHILVYLYFIVLLGIATIPHWGVIIISTTKAQVWPLQFTGVNYSKLFDVENGFGQFVINTLIFSFIATILIIILATLAGYVANRKKFKGQTLFDTLVTIPIAIPGVVLGIGYFRMFADTEGLKVGGLLLTLNPILAPAVLLIISYTIRKFPFTVRAVYAGLQQTDEVLEESAINLGASKARVLREIIIPLIALNIVGGALVSLVYNMSEVSTTLILVSDTANGTITWKMAQETGKIAELAAMGVFLMILQVISLLVTNVLLKNRADAISGI